MSVGEYLKQLNPNLLAIIYQHSALFDMNNGTDWSWRSSETGFYIDGNYWRIDPQWFATYSGSTLTSSIDPSATSLPVADLSQFLRHGRSFEYAVISNGTTTELVKVTGRSA
jgi:hypothetical protein